MSERTKHAWLVNGLLAVILVLLAGYYTHGTRTAQAAGGGWETDGVMAMTSSNAQERLVLIDTKKQNMMIYRSQGGGMFRLVGARSYQYDVEIDDSDTAGSVLKAQGITWFEAKHLYEASHNK
jgi:hypothetical protein